MRSSIGASLFFVFAVACSTAPRTEPGVRVYQADLDAPEGKRSLPSECRLLAQSAPLDQMESERAIQDPYRKERERTAAAGGNVLLVLSRATVVRPNPDCPTTDRSADCLRRSENWYKVVFRSYACDPGALSDLAQREPAPGNTSGGFQPFAPRPASSTAVLAPKVMKSKLLSLLLEGIGTEVLVSFVRSHPISRPLTAEEIVDWKRSGIPEEAIAAALPR